jgi:hypothetical protein
MLHESGSPGPAKEMGVSLDHRRFKGLQQKQQGSSGDNILIFIDIYSFTVSALQFYG